MHKTDRSEQARPAVGPRLDGRVRALREGEVMGAYMDFDRTADRAWTPAEYLVRFGEYVSQRTAEVNNGEPLPAGGDERPNVEFSGVPAGHSSNHPAGGTSAETQG